MQNNKVNVFKKMLGMIMVAPVALSLSLFAADPVPQHLWSLDETAGSTYVDSAGGADGTCTEPGCPTPILGQVNGSQDFNGTEADMIIVPGTAGFDWGPDANVTIEFWMKSGALQEISDNDVMIGRTAGNIKWYIGIDGANAGTLGHIRAYILGGNSVSGNTKINNDEWNHIAFVLNPSQVRVYVNGEYDFNITRTQPATDLSSFDTNVTIGTLDAGGGVWDYTGQLDEITVYDVELNASLIQQHYEMGLQPNLAEVTAVPTPTNDNTPNYTFSSDEAGTIEYAGGCTSTTTDAIVGDNTITFDTLLDGTYSDCTITVIDAAANPSAALAVSEFVVDTTAPALAEVTAVQTPTNDNTPNYTFSSDEAGTIEYAGGCTSTTTDAIVGDNTITFDTLLDETYSDCTITVTDAASNASDPLAVSEFVVVTTTPTLVEVTAVPTPTNDNTPNYTFSSDEAGTIEYAGGCTSADTAAIAGDNTITFDALADGIYNDCTITVTDAASNASDPLAVSEFVVDTTAPALAEVTAVPTPTNDNTPDYTFSSDEAGTITYGGSCTSAETAAIAGDNTITFDALADGIYNDCTITVTDAASNASDPLAVTDFVVDTTDTTTGGGGGCTYNPNSKNFDMTFLLMMALGLLYPFRRRFLK